MFSIFIKAVEKMGLSKHDCHPELPRDKEFKGLALGGGAICLEEAVFIMGIISVVKPDVVIELGTAQGASAVAIGAALKDAGKGKLISVDSADSPPPQMAQSIALGLELSIEFVRRTNSLAFLKSSEVDASKVHLVFSDTDIPVRPKEVAMVLDKYPKGTIIIVHDTSEKHPFGPMKLKQRLKEEAGVDLDVIEFPSPRGISILKSI